MMTFLCSMQRIISFFHGIELGCHIQVRAFPRDRPLVKSQGPNVSQNFMTFFFPSCSSHKNFICLSTLTVKMNASLGIAQRVFRDAFVATEISLLEVFYHQTHLCTIYRRFYLRHGIFVIRYYHFP